MVLFAYKLMFATSLIYESYLTVTLSLSLSSDIDDNKLTGTINWSAIAAFPSLTFLAVGGNSITSTILPSELSKLSGLGTLLLLYFKYVRITRMNHSIFNLFFLLLSQHLLI